MTRQRYLPILRPTTEPDQTVRAVILDDAIEVPCHWENGLIPCLGAFCQFAAGGQCLRKVQVRHYAPALRWTPADIQPSAAELAAFAQAMDAWKADVSAAPVKPNLSMDRVAFARELAAYDQACAAWNMRSHPAKPLRPETRTTLRPIEPPQCAIAEITDRTIDVFPQPLAGVLFTCRKVRGKLDWRAWRPAEPIKGLPPPFPIVECLERIFGMPLFPPMADGEVELEDDGPATLPMPLRRKHG